MEWVGGEPYAADDESVDADWFDVRALPEMSDDMRHRISMACDTSRSETVFDTSGTG